jgi:16S rRNA (cytosine967-C5)-methyltransferase
MENQKLKIKKNILSARAVAAQVLAGLDLRKPNAAARLDRAINKTDQRARATDLVFGVIRNLTAIDLVLQKTAKIRGEHTDKKILALLRIGAYELLYVPATPEYAVLNDAADLAAGISKKSAGFVNAVLRSVQRAIQNRSAPLAGQNPRRTLPSDDKTGCVFTIDILPDPKQDLAVFLSQAFSLPTWLIRQWLTDLGHQQTQRICQASNRHPSVIVWPNPSKITAQQLQQQLQTEGLDTQPSPDEKCLKLLQSTDITGLTSFQKGLFFVQDPAAHAAINLLPAEKGWTVLDLCAAPGTKTAVLAARLQNTGRIYAADADIKRLRKVTENCRRLGIKNVEVLEPAQLEQFLSQKPCLDAVVADVPCSNTGVLARRAEARWRLDEKSILRLTQTQMEILRNAISIVRPGGFVLYSTCSILPQENQTRIQNILRQNSGLALLREQFILPAVETENDFDHDGGYAALLQKH